MKKVLFIALVAMFGMSVNAQEGFKLGGHIGLPSGDFSDFSSFSIGIDAKYIFSSSDQFDFGAATGYINGFGKDFSQTFLGAEIEIEGIDVQFLPIAVSGKFKASEQFGLGLDLGYALGINDGNDGGLYLRPEVSYSFSESTSLGLSYTNVSMDGASWNTINLGVLFSL